MFARANLPRSHAENNPSMKKQPPMTPQQAINNFKLFLELSPRNSYDQYRAAVAELAGICVQLGIVGDDLHPVKK